METATHSDAGKHGVGQPSIHRPCPPVNELTEPQTLVETTDAQKHLAPDQQRPDVIPGVGGADRSQPSRHIIADVGADELLSVPQNSFEIRPLSQDLYLTGKLVRRPKIVGIEKGQQFPRRHPDAGIASGSRTEVGLMPETHLRNIPLSNDRAVVGGTIVYYQDLSLRMRPAR